MDYAKIADEYRAESGRMGGLVLIDSSGNVYGWRDTLRNPETEKPGSVAVDSDGVTYIASGGDSYHGATSWVQQDVEQQRHSAQDFVKNRC